MNSSAADGAAASGEWRFGPLHVDAARRSAKLDGRALTLGARAFDLLVLLIEQRQRVVTKRELIDAVWSDVVVEEGNLHVQMSALRRALGDGWVATVPGRGYRFTGGAEVPPARPVAPATRDAAAPIGRTDELRAFGAALAASAGLVTLVGPGGVGKTTLARHAFRQGLPGADDGSVWVELEPARDAQGLAQAVALACGLGVGAGGDPLAALADALQPLRLALVLDNAEHLAPDVARLAALVHERAAGVRLLVTSQVALHLPHEQVLNLAPLSLPSAQAGVAEAAAAGAVALFVHRVQRYDARFALGADNVSLVVALCRRLDGLALALEMAAARVPVLGLRGLDEALAYRLQLLGGGTRASPRQRTLRATLAWSYSLLDAAQQRLLTRLGVFSGSFDAEAVRHVCIDDLAPAADGLDEWSVLDALGELVERSLVASDGLERPRMRLLESVAAFAVEQWSGAGVDESALRARHARWMQALFDRARQACLLGALGVDEARARLMPDLDNARMAFDWAQVHAPGLAVRLAPGLDFALTFSDMAAATAVWLSSAPLALGAPPPDGVGEAERALWQLHAALRLAPRMPERAVGYADAALAWFEARQDPSNCYLALGARAMAGLKGGSPQGLLDAERMRQLEQHGWSARLRLFGAIVEWNRLQREGTAAEVAVCVERRRRLALDCGDTSQLLTSLSLRWELACARGDWTVALEAAREHGARSLDPRLRRHLGTAAHQECIALLLLDRHDEALRVARRGWPLAAGAALQSYWPSLLALLAARRSSWDATITLRHQARAMRAAEGRQPEETEALIDAQTDALLALARVEPERRDLLQSDGAALGDRDLLRLLDEWSQTTASGVRSASGLPR